MIKANNLELQIRYKLLKLALKQLDKKYKHGSMGPDTFDCAGLIWYLYNELFNINILENGIGRSTTTMLMTSVYGTLYKYDEDDSNKDLSTINNGDILFFHRQSLKEYEPTAINKYPGHCGIYLGYNSFIHASRPKKSVIISSLDDEYWKSVLVGSKDIISDYQGIILNYKKEV